MSLDKIEKALELMRTGLIARFEAAEGIFEYYCPSWSDPLRTYTVTVSERGCRCDCESRVVCCHMLAKVGRAVAVFCWQARRSEFLEELEAVVEHHRQAISELPEEFRRIARPEYQSARNRLFRPQREAA